jgi:hypothetical protein
MSINVAIAAQWGLSRFRGGGSILGFLLQSSEFSTWKQNFLTQELFNGNNSLLAKSLLGLFRSSR